jgi:hypothetical protein
MDRTLFLKKLHPSITHISASDDMKDDTIHAINTMVERVVNMSVAELEMFNRVNNPIMTKQEAISAMAKGWRVTHAYFQNDEWVTLQGDLILFENEVTMSFDRFWENRKTGFDTGWKIWLGK